MQKTCMKSCRLYSAFICLLAIVACTPPTLAPRTPPPAMQIAAPADFPTAWYDAAAARGEALLRIDAATSLVEIEVRRGGSMARFGHDHIVASHNVQGLVAPKAGRADLFVALEELTVDEPDLRLAAGLTTEPSAEAIAGTRRNMLDKVLESQLFPHVLISVRQLDAGTLHVELRLHGVRRGWDIPARIDNGADGMQVSGQLQFLQSDFGITPFSVLGGALQVQDALTLRFKIHAIAF